LLYKAATRTSGHSQWFALSPDLFMFSTRIVAS
jgi:hypothetical protein